MFRGEGPRIFGFPLLLWGFVLAAGLGNILGGAAVVIRRPSPKTLMRLVALGGGFLIGAAILDMLPQVMDAGKVAGPVSILGGYMGMVFLENLATEHAHRYDQVSHKQGLGRNTALGVWIGMIVHTFFDGVSIAAGFLSGGLRLGIIIFEAVILHNAGDGWSVSSVVLASGNSRKRAFGAAVSIGLSTVLGAVITLVFHTLSHGASEIFLGISMGTFLYIAMTDLIPAVHESEESRVLVGFVLLGMLFFALSSFLGG